jgi:hypothetical protein
VQVWAFWAKAVLWAIQKCGFTLDDEGQDGDLLRVEYSGAWRYPVGQAELREWFSVALLSVYVYVYVYVSVVPTQSHTVMNMYASVALFYTDTF